MTRIITGLVTASLVALMFMALTGFILFDDVINHSNEFHGVEETSRQQRRVVKQIIPGALSLLTYLCCSNADIQAPPPAPVRSCS